MTKLKVGIKYKSMTIEASGIDITVIKKEGNLCTLLVEGVMESEVW